MLFWKILSKPALALIGGLALFGAGVCSAQIAANISIVSGDGQLLRQNNLGAEPLTVRITDAAGKPVSGAIVNWATTSGVGNTLNTSTTTDINGLASTQFVAGMVSETFNLGQSTVTASLANTVATATFTETSLFVNNTNAYSIFVDPSTLNSALSGQSGTLGAPVKLLVTSLNGFTAGQGINHVSVQLYSNSTSGSQVSCQGGVVYTDATGSVICTPVFSGSGTGTFTLSIGGKSNLQDFTRSLTVTPGVPGLLTISGGNNQSGIPGMTLTVPLTAIVSDPGGTPISGVPVVFEAVTPGSVTFTNVNATSDAFGKVSATAILGSGSGPYNIRVRSASGTAFSALYTVTINAVVSGLMKVSGDTQTGLISAAFGQPVRVQVNDPSAKGLAGIPVTFTVTQGAATLGTATATTDASGRASTTVSAGATPGPITITATSSGFAQTFTLTSTLPGPVLTSSSFTNAASAQAGGLAPGAIVTITGPGIAPNLQGSASAAALLGNVLSIQIANVTVQFNGIYAPVFSVSNINGRQSVTVQVPFEVAPGAATVTVTVNGVAAALSVTVQPYSPGLFEITGVDNVRRALIVNQDGTVVSPSNPARRNQTLRAYATGLGSLAPAIGSNQFSPVDGDPIVVAPVIVGVNNAGTQVISSIYARNLVGVEEIRFVIPDPPPGGVSIPSSANVPFVIAVQNATGDLVFSQGSVIAVQ